MLLDHARRIRPLVPWDDDEAPWVGPDRLVLRVRYLEGLRTVIAATLADEANQQRILLSVASERIRHLRDALVYLAEQGLVVRPPLLGRIHAPPFSPMVRLKANPFLGRTRWASLALCSVPLSERQRTKQPFEE